MLGLTNMNGTWDLGLHVNRPSKTNQRATTIHSLTHESKLVESLGLLHAAVDDEHRRLLERDADPGVLLHRMSTLAEEQES